jgi:hypothetical protein
MSHAGAGASHAGRAFSHPQFVGGFHHGRSAVFFDGGFGWGWGWPYPYYDYGYGYAPYYYSPYEAYERVGKEWGKDLKKGTATVDQLIAFMQADLLRASDQARSSFQVGLMKGYGKNALTLYSRAFGQARATAPREPMMAPPPPPPPAPGAPAANPPAQSSSQQPLSAPKYQ